MNIVYIDDEQDGINTFRRSMLLNDSKAEVKGFRPLYTMEETYDLIMENKDIEAVITDYELSDSCDVGFTGAEFIQYLLEKHPMLPCFVLTAFEDSAVKSDAVDVYQVYPKSILHDDTRDTNSEHSISFYDLILQQIEKTKRKIASLERELLDLIRQKGGQGWTSEKEDRLIYIDDILEHHNGGSKISRSLKKDAYTEKVIELISVTQSLLKEVKGDA